MFNTTIQQYHNVCVYVCMCLFLLCVSSQSMFFYKVYIYLLFKSDLYCFHQLPDVENSHCSMYYCVPPIVCSGLGDCEETSSGMTSHCGELLYSMFHVSIMFILLVDVGTDTTA